MVTAVTVTIFIEMKFSVNKSGKEIPVKQRTAAPCGCRGSCL